MKDLTVKKNNDRFLGPGIPTIGMANYPNGPVFKFEPKLVFGWL